MQNKPRKQFKDIEFLGFLLAIFLSIKEAPAVFNVLTFNIFKNVINETILSWAYIFIVRSIALKYLNTYELPQDLSLEGLKENIQHNEQTWRFQRAVFSFGLIPLREYILGKMTVEGFVTDANPNDSGNFPYRDNVHYIKKHFEYRYPKDYSNLLITLRSWENEEDRSHSDYKPYNELATAKEKITLLMASNFYWKWLIQRFFHKINKFFR